jgi:hypothetical protein
MVVIQHYNGVCDACDRPKNEAVTHVVNGSRHYGR